MKIVNVIGYEGLYAVSDQGVIYNLKRGTIVKPTKDKSGYLSVILTRDGVQYPTKVHKVVFYSFVGQDGLTREDSLVIDHLDGDKTNNALYNLRKTTTRENTSRSKTPKYGRGFHFYEKICKFGAEIQINKVRYFLGTFDSAEDASIAYETALERYEKDGILPEKRRKQK